MRARNNLPILPSAWRECALQGEWESPYEVGDFKFDTTLIHTRISQVAFPLEKEISERLFHDGDSFTDYGGSDPVKFF